MSDALQTDEDQSDQIQLELDDKTKKKRRWHEGWVVKAIVLLCLSASLSPIFPPVRDFISRKYSAFTGAYDCLKKPHQGSGEAFLTIALSHLDKDDEILTPRIWNALNASLTGNKGKDIELLRVCTVIHTDFDDSHSQWIAAAASGRRQLEEAKADLLIWGEKKTDEIFQLNWLGRSGERDLAIDKIYQLKDFDLSPEIKIVIEKTIVSRVEKLMEGVDVERIVYPDVKYLGVDGRAAALERLYAQVLSISGLRLMQQAVHACQVKFLLGRIALSLARYDMTSARTIASQAEGHFSAIAGSGPCAEDRAFIVRIEDYLGDVHMSQSDRAAPSLKQAYYDNAVSFYKNAVKERRPRDLHWAISQFNLGTALNFPSCVRANESLTQARSERLVQAREAYDSARRTFRQLKDIRQAAAEGRIREIETCLARVHPSLRPALPRQELPAPTSRDQPEVEAGLATLTCDITSIGPGLFAREGEIDCTYKTPRRRPRNYKGKISSVGLFIQSPARERVVWEIHKLTNRPVVGLDGNYRQHNLPTADSDSRVFIDVTGNVILRPQTPSALVSSFVLGANSLVLSEVQKRP